MLGIVWTNCEKILFFKLAVRWRLCIVKITWKANHMFGAQTFFCLSFFVFNKILFVIIASILYTISISNQCVSVMYIWAWAVLRRDVSELTNDFIEENGWCVVLIKWTMCVVVVVFFLQFFIYQWFSTEHENNITNYIIRRNLCCGNGH